MDKKTPRHMVSLRPDVFVLLEQTKDQMEKDLSLNLSFSQVVQLLVKRYKEEKTNV